MHIFVYLRKNKRWIGSWQHLRHFIFSDDSKQRIDQLYDMRNNVHILKAVKTNYAPKKHEAKDAYSLMIQVVSELKSFYNNNS